MQETKREIEFRAWHEDNQQLFSVFGFTDEIVIDEATFLSWPRNECVLMQFTGLCDSKGQKVFEGDILYSYYPGVDHRRPSTEYWRLVAYRAGGFCELTNVGEEVSEIETTWLSEYRGSKSSGLLPHRVVGCYYVRPDLLALNTETGEVPEAFN